MAVKNSTEFPKDWFEFHGFQLFRSGVCCSFFLRLLWVTLSCFWIVKSRPLCCWQKCFLTLYDAKLELETTQLWLSLFPVLYCIWWGGTVGEDHWSERPYMERGSSGMLGSVRVKQTSSIDLAVELMRLFLLLSWKHGCGAVLSALHQTQHLYQDV